ncbi:hypothetical protein JYU34_014529 [Plutella xylostella]|uniref:Uncharacterized protein n=1 Tax=Plutella xylostella TaxID=51655 RepID=A0ABQ7Q8N6_PLUXY|nr:hypothetical protein JYU34_014529 [Plutella xylostella]
MPHFVKPKMRFTKVLLLFSSFLVFAIAKPAYINDQINDRYEEAEEGDYDAMDEEGGVEEPADLQEEANVKDSRANYDAEEEPPSGPEAERQLRRARLQARIQAQAEDRNADEESEQTVQDSEDADEEPEPQDNRQRSAMDYENEERPRPRQHTPARNRYKHYRQREYDARNNRMPQQNLDDEAALENSGSVHNQKQKYSNAEYSDANDDSDYENYRNYNTMNTKNKKGKMESSFYGNITANRQRRHADVQNATSAPVEKPAGEVAKKEEEAAIKRHIDKLTTDELEQLLSTLSEDKRTLLAKIIMDNDKNVNAAKLIDNSDLRKREITKKAGAMNENNLIDSNQLDEKAQGGADISSDVTNLLSGNGTINNMVVEAENITDSTQSALVADKTEVNKEVNLVANAAEPAADPTPKSSDPEQQSPAKTANKREARYDHFRADDSALMDQNLLDEQENFCNRDDQLTDYANEESDMYENNNIRKRHIIYEQENSDINDSMNSLEDSFGNSNTYDEIDSGSDMEPHVRVKRKNPDLVVKKRAAALLPESKVAYVPFRTENEDEDTAEANEFEDDGLYVRPSNLEGDLNNKEVPQSKVRSNKKRFNFRASDSNRQASDVGIGSDSDSVLSGSEGVDDNLMFNNAARNKRSANVGAQYTNENEDADKLNDRAEMAAESQKLSDHNMNLAYQENDAFGPLPRNYEGELNRYKRIRRVKHLPASHDNE